MRSWTSAVVALALGTSPLAVMTPGAQQFVLSSQDRAKLIAIDFAAVGADGLPVTDLAPGDVKVRVGGHIRPVRALDYVPLSSDSVAAGVPAPYGTNVAPAHGRTLVLLVDLESIRPGGEATLRAHVGGLVRTLSRTDRLALVTIPYGGVKVDLTTDHASVSRVLATLSGQAPASETASEAACRTRTTLVALRGALDDLRGGDAPVTAIVVSGRLSAPQTVLPMTTGTSLGRCQLQREHFEQVGAAAAGARAQVYVVHPALSLSTGGLEGLEHLTGVTNAPLWHFDGTDGTDGALTRILRETGGYYLARIEPDPDEAQGSLHGLSIEVSRPGVTVRARPQVAVARPSPRAAAIPLAPMAMMREAGLYRDLPLRVVGFASREPGSDVMRVNIVFDSPDPAAVPSEAMVGLFADDGRLVSSRVLTAADLGGPVHVTAVTAPAGRYRLRVAAVEASGRGGTADILLEAGLGPAGALRLSDLVLGLSRDGQFRPRLEFAGEATAMAQLEVYGGREGARVGVIVEVAPTVNGPAVVTVPGVFAATGEADRFVVTAAVPIGALPAGDYVVRATVAAEGQAGGRVVRPLRKVVQRVER